MADATDLKSVPAKAGYGFDSHHRHPLKCNFTREDAETPRLRETHGPDRAGRRLQPFCSSRRMARTVTVPPVTGVLMRALKVPETLPANHSVALFGGTGIVFSVVQTNATPPLEQLARPHLLLQRKY